MGGRRVVVMGLGRFGGGVGAVRYLVRCGAAVTVTDLADGASLRESLARIADLPVRVVLGEHPLGLLEGCDAVVVNPAVDWRRSGFVAEARRRGIVLTSEMNLFLERCAAPVIGVTGTAGKSTTCAALGVLLESALAETGRRVWVGGNIGRSLLAHVEEIGGDDLVVLEMSSFQLEQAGWEGRSPAVAVVTSFAPNHLDRHGSVGAYARAKQNITRFQRPGDHFVFCADEDALRSWVSVVPAGVTIWRYGVCGADLWYERSDGERRTVRGFSWALPGRHNLRNAAGALCAAAAAGVDAAPCAESLREFRGLAHRLEFVGAAGGVRYYNDSKSTTPEATVVAVEAFDQPVVLIVGGRSKGGDYEGMARRVRGRVRGVVCMGEAGPMLRDCFRRCGVAAEGPVVCVARLAEAVGAARTMARAGDVVVLSPGCASYDEFGNYEERGEMFRRLVGGAARAASGGA